MKGVSCFLLTVSIFFTCQICCHGISERCQGTDDKLSTCSFDLLLFISEEANTTDEICGAVETFLKCHHGVSIVCPDNILLQDSNFQENVESLQNQVDQSCPRNVREMLCNYDALFEHFAPMCYPLIQSAPNNLPLNSLCSNARQYLRCLETANAPCVDTERNLNRSIHITNLGLQYQCSEEQLKASAAALNEDKRDTSAMNQMPVDVSDIDSRSVTFDEESCADTDLGAHVAMCSRHVLTLMDQETPTIKHICKSQRRYLLCIRRLMKKCSNAQNLLESSYESAKESMVTLCEVNSGRCPFDVLSGDRTVLEYCTATRVPSEIGSPEFCRHIESIPMCLVRTKTRCRHRGVSGRDIRDGLIAVNATLSIYCANDVEERSMDFNVNENGEWIGQFDDDTIDLDERSSSIGQADDNAMFEGNEVEELESVVKVLQSRLPF